MKKLLILLTLSIAFLFPLSAESKSLNTEITSVSMGPQDFGFGLAPAGTNFLYYKYINLSEKLKFNAFFSSRLIFYFPNQCYFGGYNYKTGNPYWFNKYYEIKDLGNEYWLSGYYFRPETQIDIGIRQGFFTNPIDGNSALLTLGVYLNSHYSLILEDLNVYEGKNSPIFLNPNTNSYNEPFGPDSVIPAYPWLQDTRSNLVNNIRITADINLGKSKGFNVSDGVYVYTIMEFGPEWLANNISMNATTSNYYKLSGSISEHLTLYSKKQDNGLNWLSMQLIHSNGFQHIGGSVVPEHKIPTDRLQNSFSDSVTLNIIGPQFIAWDCYTDFTIGLYTTCLWGNIVNEASKKTYATEWLSSISANFHMRLFGFMHFSYDFGYTFFNGINTWNPGFYQNAKISFYISL